MPTQIRSYQFHQELTIASGQLDETVLDIPLLADQNVLSNSIFVQANSSGLDITVADSAGNEFPTEKVWNSNSERLEVWWLANTAAENDNYFVWWGDEGSVVNDSRTLWTTSAAPGYEALWHMQESGDLLDSALGSSDASIEVNSPHPDEPKFGAGAQQYDNGPRHADTGVAYTVATEIEFSCWANPSNIDPRNVIVRKENNFINYDFSGGFSWFLWRSVGNLRFQTVTESLFNVGSWSYYVSQYKRNDYVAMFRDGSLVNCAAETDDGNVTMTTDRVGIGRNYAGTSDPWEGRLDELRIGHLCHSPAWLLSNYRNQVATNTFFITAGAVGSDDGGGGGGEGPGDKPAGSFNRLFPRPEQRDTPDPLEFREFPLP